ncbi:peroxiredoxin family protein [Candidatus Magnetomonas plexicatena]|uniref:peroxiredoxin family protein n=1 Tax=Candidatus Magnetomonas plexicatena TaxID=2552947 RepID=UPI001C772BFA|nr:TlpA family protein disulfide reductase [Nitrospirales bacterium LBB_01]
MSKRVLFYLVICVSVLFYVSPVFSVPPAPWELDEIDGKPAPNFEMQSINGNTVSLSSIKGKVVLLNFWATWCPPCKEEMPSMDALYKMFKNDNFVVLAATSNSSSDVKKFAQKNHVSFQFLLDPKNKIAKSFKVYMLPVTFLISKEGVIVKKYIGAQNWTESAIVNDVKKLL